MRFKGRPINWVLSLYAAAGITAGVLHIAGFIRHDPRLHHLGNIALVIAVAVGSLPLVLATVWSIGEWLASLFRRKR